MVIAIGRLVRPVDRIILYVEDAGRMLSESLPVDGALFIFAGVGFQLVVVVAGASCTTGGMNTLSSTVRPLGSPGSHIETGGECLAVGL